MLPAVGRLAPVGCGRIGNGCLRNNLSVDPAVSSPSGLKSALILAMYSFSFNIFSFSSANLEVRRILILFNITIVSTFSFLPLFELVFLCSYLQLQFLSFLFPSSIIMKHN